MKESKGGRFYMAEHSVVLKTVNMFTVIYSINGLSY